jgi:hypothetical protein
VRLEIRSSKILCSLLMIALLVSFVTSLSAQEPSPNQTMATLAQRTSPPPRNDKSKATFTQSNQDGWAWVTARCTDPTSDSCAEAAIVEVSQECGASSKFFKKDTKVWEWITFSLVIASASFTGVGASATIANAKVYSTLGGTTGLGAVTSTTKANVAGDQAGLMTVNTTLTNFLKFVQTGGANNQPPDNDLIYKSAPLYGAQCEAAANGSTGTSK